MDKFSYNEQNESPGYGPRLKITDILKLERQKESEREKKPPSVNTSRGTMNSLRSAHAIPRLLDEEGEQQGSSEDRSQSRFTNARSKPFKPFTDANWRPQRGGRGRQRGNTPAYAGHRNSERGGDRQEFVPMTKRLRDLENVEPNEVLMALISPRSGFLKMFQRPKIKEEELELLVMVLERACQSVHSPLSLSSLLQSVNESRFLMEPLVEYLTTRTISGCLSSEILLYVVEITKMLMHHLPSSSSSNVTRLLSQVHSWISQNSGRDEVSVVRECLNVAEEMRKDILKSIRGGDMVRDEDIGTSVDEEPPDDFRKIPVMPTALEIKSDEPPFLRKNIIYGAYKTVDHYLDVQYRLLREDFVCPLRDGLRMLLASKDRNVLLKKISDIRFYSKVQILTPYCAPKGIMYRARFDVSRFTKIRWESSKRLIFGSLVGLSKDNFENIIFGTVAARDPNELCKGIIDLFFEDENSYKLDSNPYTEYQMVECSAYFEAYRHVLQGLQEMQGNSLPFHRYLLNQCSDIKAVDPPRYLRGHDIRYDFSCLLEKEIRFQSIAERYSARKYSDVRILDPEAWPSADLLGLDESQYKALQTAMSKEFVTIQGPPGTGKTFIGLKIVQLFLKNKQCWLGRQGDHSPILIVCYTNHALDQFLEGILALCDMVPGDLVRVGSRSVTENKELQRCTLFEIKSNQDRNEVSQDVHHGIRGIKDQLAALEDMITADSAQIECARKFLMHERLLQRFMTHQQANSLFSMEISAPSLLPFWLGLYDNIQNYLEQDERYENQDNDVDALVEDDIEEVKQLEEERMIDESFKSQRNQHLRKIKEMSEKCPDIVNIGGELAQDGFQITKQAKKKQKQQTRQNLGFHNVMTRDEAETVVNVWQLTTQQKWRLYNFWVSKYCEELSLMVRARNSEYNRLANLLTELNKEEEFAILRKASVIGMTTTAAAKNRQLLQRVHPKITIVEEAAEVLEAHVVTTLSHRCEHLIMIGDHRQLRPNPTVYRLAREFHLDISLFERMIKNEIHCDQLTIQHRMRPEIVSLIVPHVYKKLLNDESVLIYDNIKGIKGNLFFVNHLFQETSVEDTKSRSNEHEARYLACLSKYLLQQGYRPSQITVLTTYTGQMFLLRKMMPKDAFEGIRITPVDNYQGEENDIVLLSLVRSNEEGKIGFLQTHNRVCVALSRAKMGLYVIGNMDMMADGGVLWNDIMKDLKRNSRLVDALPLACQNHPDSVIHAKLPDDFLKAPEGGCMLDCGFRLDCGHVCILKCHPKDPKHEAYMCEKRCLKILCERNHQCPKSCYEKCTKCCVLVEKIIPRCHHLQMVKCHVPESDFPCQEPCTKILSCGHVCQNKCGTACSERCPYVVPDRPWPCGHRLTVECFRNPDNFLCNVEVEKVLPCRHNATVICSMEVSDYKCSEQVDISLCGDLEHSKKITCHMRDEYIGKKCEANVKVACQYNKMHTFMTRCFEKDWNKCPLKCNAPIECGHLCSGNCGMCNDIGKKHQPCQAHCKKKLGCGHDCQGKCGESCPPCGLQCNLFCGHKRCNIQCGSVCNPCELSCKWNCPHEKCDRLCMEPCTRPPCDKPCINRLPNCGHRCAGLCGELCCPVCASCKSHIYQTSMDYLKLGKLNKHTRFVWLQPCGHFVEVNYMDKWVKDSVPIRPCAATYLSCPLCNGMVGNCTRYNARIKQYMVEINDIKRVSLMGQRFSFQANHAIAALWPTNSTEKKVELLGDVASTQESRLFQRLVLGAVCVWQECLNVVQICKKKSNSNVEDEVSSLEQLKARLATAIDGQDKQGIARSILDAKRLNLILHAKRMLTFIKNPRLINQLESVCLSLSVKRNFTDIQTLVFQSSLTNANEQLSSNFTMQQKENIANFLKHFDEFFQHNIQSTLKITKWMLCSQDHVFGISENIPNDELEKHCSHCYPEDSGDVDDTIYRKNISAIIHEILNVSISDGELPVHRSNSKLSQRLHLLGLGLPSTLSLDDFSYSDEEIDTLSDYE